MAPPGGLMARRVVRIRGQLICLVSGAQLRRCLCRQFGLAEAKRLHYIQVLFRTDKSTQVFVERGEECSVLLAKTKPPMTFFNIASRTDKRERYCPLDPSVRAHLFDQLPN